MVTLGAENRPVPSIYEQTIQVGGSQISLLQMVIMGIVVFHINRAFDSLDSTRLTELKD